MINEIRIEISPSGQNELRLLLKGENLPDLGEEIFKPPCMLVDDDIRKLRSGQPENSVVEKVADLISQWLLDPEIRLYLVNALNTPGETVRVIFSMSDRLRPLLADVPFELLQLEKAQTPLAVNKRVNAIVYHLPKVVTTQNPPAAQGWPLRILIVRSNPPNLGGAVPPAEPLRAAIMQIAQDAANIMHQPLTAGDLVRIDVVSSETPGAGKVTLDAIEERLNGPAGEAGSPYHILLYIGHGDFPPDFQDQNQTIGPELQLEDPQTGNAIPVSVSQLTGIIGDKVPVVLLAGCVTAQNFPAPIKPLIDREIPDWMRACQGLAQALVNSSAGVQVAVGMRYLLETDDAVRFLNAFFRSLMIETPGHIEAAVRAGRIALHTQHPFPPSWSAPVLFRTMRPEPLFDLTKPPVPRAVEDQVEFYKTARLKLWEVMALQAAQKRLPGISEAIDASDEQLRMLLQPLGPVIMPHRSETQPGAQTGVLIELYGDLNVDVLAGRLIVSGGDARFKALKLTQQVNQSGYRLAALAIQDRTIDFKLERGMGATPLPAGPLFDIDLMLGTGIGIVYIVSMAQLATMPDLPISASSNAILVPPQ